MKKLLLSITALMTVSVLAQADETVTDICGNTYPVVTIGSQTWMAENLKCNKYDTESEAYSVEWPVHNTLTTTTSSSYTPYYVDATDQTNWDNTSKEMAYRIRTELIAKLGYHYNWAAAVGTGDGSIQKNPFVGHRQGICPNGWHIPTKAEWDKLVSNIGGREYGGKILKKTSGWYCSKTYCGNGIDAYGFAALPAGFANGNVVSEVVDYAYFWTSTTIENGEEAYLKCLSGGREINEYTYLKTYGSSVRCVKNTIIVSPDFKTFESDGGAVEVNISSDKQWSASSNQNWAKLSKTSGERSEIITINVDKGVSQYIDTARITFFAQDQTPVVMVICRKPGMKIPEKCNASDYKQVTIGTQVWMAENYRCSKYDTESEAYNASWLTNNTIQISDSIQSTPFCSDAADMSKWSSSYKGNLNRTQISQLGYLYNWAAVVGIDNLESFKEAFEGDRQGICPNGWHIPSYNELTELVESVGGQAVAGVKMKSISGWYNDGNGTDDYGFSALPTDGTTLEIWSSTPWEYIDYGAGNAYAIEFYYGSDKAFLHCDFSTCLARSVRCIKNPIPTAATESEAVAATTTYKVIENGQIVIVAGDRKFNLQGVEIK